MITLASRELLLDGTLVAFDGLGLALGAALLWRRSPRAVPLTVDSGVALLFGLFWLAVTAAVIVVFFHSRFGALSAVVHALLFVAAPLATARGIHRFVVGRRAGGAFGVSVGCCIVAVYAFAHFVEPYRLAIDTHRIVTPRATRLGRPLRVALVADIQTDHVGDWERHVFDELGRARPDLVLLAGDYVQNARPDEFASERAAFRALFDDLRPWPPLGVCAVIGDIDPDPTILDGTRVRMLRDETIFFEHQPRLRLVGLGVDASRRGLTQDFAAQAAGFDGYTIVLGHAPDFAIPVIEGKVQLDALLLAGHTHGGQIAIPGFGPPLTLSAVPREVAAGGLHAYGDCRVCVSRGIGMERGVAPRVRLFCRPQIVIFEIGADS